MYQSGTDVMKTQCKVILGKCTLAKSLLSF